jgi:hypothetical protein
MREGHHELHPLDLWKSKGEKMRECYQKAKLGAEAKGGGVEKSPCDNISTRGDTNKHGIHWGKKLYQAYCVHKLYKRS